MKEVLKLVKEPRRLDMTLIGIVLMLMTIGVAMVYSATVNEPGDWYQSFWFKQSMYFVVGWGVAFLILITKPHFWFEFAYPAFLLSIIGLIVVLFIGGIESHGAGRWIAIGPVRLQPSEFAKIGYLLALSRYFSSSSVSLERPTSFIVPGMLFIVPFILVMKQPDLSTALVFMSMTLMAFYWSGLSLPDLFLLLSPGMSVIAAMNQFVWGALMAIVAAVIWMRRLPVWLTVVILILNIAGGFASYTVWNSVLEDHQRSRILTFIDPMREPKGAGYQVIQSKLAIGSGGIFGKGYGSGSQTNLSFLPEEHTDFIFSVLGEQFGFLGASFVLILYFLLMMRTFNITQIHSHPFVIHICVGASTIILFHVFVNVGMTLGMMPVTGLPLPFLSYGGSFVLTCMTLVGFFLLMRFKGDDI